MARYMFASLAALIVLVAGCPPAYTLNETNVCREPSAPDGRDLVAFTSPREVLGVIEKFEKDKLGGSCPDKFRAAFARLKWVLNKEQVMKDICGREAYRRIRSFHLEFIYYYVPEMTIQQVKIVRKEVSQLKAIPRALRSFFIAFATQVNAACKQQLVQRIESLQTDHNMVNDEDFATIEQFKTGSHRLGSLKKLLESEISQKYGPSNGCEFEKLEIVDRRPKPRASEDKLDLVDSSENELDDGSILYVKVPFDHQLRRVKEACLKRFMPVYMELFAPVIRLNNLGYVDRLNTEREDEVLREVNIARWIDIIQTCEVLKDIEILHDCTAEQALVDIIKDNSHLLELNKRNKINKNKKSSDAEMWTLGSEVKLLSRQEAEQLKQSIETSKDGIIMPLYDPEPARVEHEPLGFTPRMWLTDAKKVQAQAKEFSEHLRMVIVRKTSKIHRLKAKIDKHMKETLFTRKSPNSNQRAMLERLSDFTALHSTMIKGVSICLSAILVACVFFTG